MEKQGSFGLLTIDSTTPMGMGFSLLDHVAAMLNGVVYSKQLPFMTVLIDSWYATQKLMGQVDQLKKVYYCPLKSNRRVDDSGGTQPYQRIDELGWSAQELQQGKLIKIRGFPCIQKRATVPGHCFHQQDGGASLPTTYLKLLLMLYKMCVASVGSQSEFHRELKQLTGVEACQCRKARIQRNHIACAMLVWSRLKMSAYQTGKTVYQIKHGMLSDYLIEQLRNPFVKMSLA